MTEADMQNNYWETGSSNCCHECGHLLSAREDACLFCDGNQTYNCTDIKSLDQIENNILFDDEKYFDDISFDD